MKIDFVGELNDKMKGFYRSKYTTPTGDTRYAAVTQFEVRAAFLFARVLILMGSLFSAAAQACCPGFGSALGKLQKCFYFLASGGWAVLKLSFML